MEKRMNAQDARTHRKWIQARKAYLAAYYALRTATRRRETAETIERLREEYETACREWQVWEKRMEVIEW